MRIVSQFTNNVNLTIFKFNDIICHRNGGDINYEKEKDN